MTTRSGKFNIFGGKPPVIGRRIRHISGVPPVIGRGTRHIPSGFPLAIGKGAGVILTANDGRILLQHRDKNNRWNQYSWSEFGGQIEENETAEKAVKRELKEELGIDLANLEFFKKYPLQREKGIYEQFIFTASLDCPIERLKKQQKEGKDLALFTYEEIKNLKMADYTREILEDFFKEKFSNKDSSQSERYRKYDGGAY